MNLYFITGNKNKFNEIKEIIPEIKQLIIDLPEIQDFDSKKIIEEKLKEALKHKKGNFIVEDTSLYLDCLNGFPGPFIKWFLKSLGVNGIFEITKKMGNYNASAVTIIGYANRNGEMHFFKGEIFGEIVKPKVKSDFGWDPIFKPKNYDVSFAELSREEKNNISMRSIAVRKLSKFLENNK